jgi:hypothetical protein
MKKMFNPCMPKETVQQIRATWQAEMKKREVDRAWKERAKQKCD